MGSIPLPALSIHPPEQGPSPLEQYAQLVKLRSMQQQQQLGQQEIIGAQQKNQLQGLQIQDQQGLRDAAKGIDWSQPDAFDKFTSNAAAKNVSPQTLSQLALQRAQFKEQLAKTDQQQLATDLEKNNRLAGHLDAVLKVPDGPERKAELQRQLTTAQQEGLLKDPNVAQGLLSGPTDDEHLKLFENSLLDHKTQVQQALDTQKANAGDWKEMSALGVLVNTRTGEVKSPAGQVMTPAMLESKYLQIQQKKNLGQPLNADEGAFVKGYEHMKTLVPAFNFNLQNSGAQGQNGQPSAIAQAIASGQMKWSDAVSPRTPMAVKEAILKEVKGINPQFNSGDFTVEQKVREKFTSGNVSDQLMAINTAREHMKTFGELADALDNNDTQALNRIGNFFGVQFGSDKTTNFRIAAQAFGGEVGKAFDGAHVTAGEREQAASAFNPNMSPQQFRGAIKTVDALLAGKQRAAQQSYQSGTQGQPNFGQPQSSSNLPGAGKTLTQAQLQQAAKDHGKTIEQATAEARAQGYQIQ